MDGYVLLKRIYTSIASLNKYLIRQQVQAASTSFYSMQQKRLFVTLVNGCFRQPPFCINSRYFNNSNERVCEIVNMIVDRSTSLLSPSSTSTSGLYLVNSLLLTQVVLEYELWLPFESLTTNSVVNSETTTGGNLWRHLFQIIYKLLEEDKSTQMYHTGLFLSNELHQKLVFFLLDANEERFYIDAMSCHAFMQIFGHFGMIFGGANAKQAALSFITPKLFCDFAEFLYSFHPDSNVYIVNQKSEFYFNISLSKFFIVLFKI